LGKCRSSKKDSNENDFHDFPLGRYHASSHYETSLIKSS
jgi:hypothetical protein